MKKKIIAAAFLCMVGGIANAGTLGNKTTVNADFTVTGGCTVNGTWSANKDITAAKYEPTTQLVGGLTISLTGCNSQVFFEGNEKDTVGAPLATGPNGNKIPFIPGINDLAANWVKDAADNVFYSKRTLNDGESISVGFYNKEAWTAEPGNHTMVLNVGTYTI
ncbi:TPA: CD15/CS22/SEF14 family fimbrial major subunit [Escherichia coli]|nr:CD15/CS22/SEF14 family fimbrial major subunit [Escherichia coli]HCN0025436.1 CD15/CS22/SEF14 family fimbrial major subunit [Escherichia coli]